MQIQLCKFWLPKKYLKERKLDLKFWFTPARPSVVFFGNKKLALNSFRCTMSPLCLAWIGDLVFFF